MKRLTQSSSKFKIRGDLNICMYLATCGLCRIDGCTRVWETGSGHQTPGPFLLPPDLRPVLDVQDLVASGQQPGIALLERCVMRAERSADVPALRLLMGRLDLLNYKIVGAAAKVRLVFCTSPAMRLLMGRLQQPLVCLIWRSPPPQGCLGWE